MASSELTTANETIARLQSALDQQLANRESLDALRNQLATKEAELLTLRALRDMLILDGHVEHSKDDLPGYLRALIDALIECRAELLACRADAERLDWLEDVIRCYWLRIQSQPSGDDVWHGQGKGLRAAIDAAIKAGAQS